MEKVNVCEKYNYRSTSSELRFPGVQRALPPAAVALIDDSWISLHANRLLYTQGDRRLWHEGRLPFAGTREKPRTLIVKKAADKTTSRWELLPVPPACTSEPPTISTRRHRADCYHNKACVRNGLIALRPNARGHSTEGC